MDPGRFRQLLDAPGPFASVFFDDSHHIHDPPADFEAKWRALRDQLEAQGAHAGAIADIEQAVNDLQPPIGWSGRAVVAGADGVVVNELLLRPTAQPMVRVSELPYIVPILEHGFEYPDYLLVVGDDAGADITVHFDGTFRTETVECSDFPVLGAPRADNAGYGNSRSRAEEAARKNIRTVADRVAELVDKLVIDAVFVVGEVRSRADLLAAFCERVRERVVPLRLGARNGGRDVIEVRQAIERWSLNRRVSLMDNALARFDAEIGRMSGRAAEGLDAVCMALCLGAVDTLIVGDFGDATVVTDEAMTAVAPNAYALSERGKSAVKRLRADEALPLFAISTGASLVRTDERISPTDGVAAVLKYSPTLR